MTLAQVHERMTQLAAEAGHRLTAFQSNSESELIERIHETNRQGEEIEQAFARLLEIDLTCASF